MSRSTRSERSPVGNRGDAELRGRAGRVIVASVLASVTVALVLDNPQRDPCGDEAVDGARRSVAAHRSRPNRLLADGCVGAPPLADESDRSAMTGISEHRPRSPFFVQLTREVFGD